MIMMQLRAFSARKKDCVRIMIMIAFFILLDLMTLFHNIGAMAQSSSKGYTESQIL